MRDLLGTLSDVVCAVLLLAGALFCLAGAVGLLRFPDTVTRLHASSKAQSLGVLLILLGAAVRVPLPYTVLLLLVAAFQLVTVPVTAQIVGRIAYYTGAVDRSSLERDELAGDPAPRREDGGSGGAGGGGECGR